MLKRDNVVKLLDKIYKPTKQSKQSCPKLRNSTNRKNGDEDDDNDDGDDRSNNMKSVSQPWHSNILNAMDLYQPFGILDVV